MAGPTIPISGDPSGIIAALRRIREELKSTGQEARNLADIDLGAMPRGMSEEIEGITRRWQELLRLPNSSLSRRLGATGQSGATPWNVDWSRLYEDPARAERMRRQVMDRVLAGTRFAPPPGGGGPHPPAGGGGTGGGSGGAGTGGAGGGGGGPGDTAGGLAGTIAGMIPMGRALKVLAGMAGLGGVVTMLGQGMRDSMATGESVTGLMRRTQSGEDTGFGAMRDEIRLMGEEFGIVGTEAAQLANIFHRATRSMDRQTVLMETQQSMAFAKGFGLEQAATARYFGEAQFAGVAGGKSGQMSQREFALMIGETVSQGGMYARTEEVMGSFQRYIDQVQSRTLLAPEGIDRFANFRAAMYEQANNGMPGLAGQAGQALIDQINSALVNPGGGESGRHVMMRALGPGVGFNPWDIEYQAEKGMFADLGNTGVTNIESIVNTVRGDTSGGGHAMLRSGLSSLLGISNHGAEALLKIIDSPAGMIGFKQRLGDAGVAEDAIKMESIGELGKILHASDDTLMSTAREYLDNGSLDEDQSKAIRAAMAAGPTEELRDELLRAANATGIMRTETEKLESELAQVRNAISDIVGDRLVPAVSFLTSGINALTAFLRGDGVENVAGLSDEKLQYEAQASQKEIDLIERARKRNEDLGFSDPEDARELDIREAEARRRLDAISAERTARDVEAMSRSGGPDDGLRGLTLPPAANDAAAVSGGDVALDSPEWRAKLLAADREKGFPDGTMWSVMMQETSGKDLGYHYEPDASGKRKSSAYGPFGILLNSTAKDPGYGVDPLQSLDKDEQLRFAADYLAARSESAGSVERGLAGYGEGRRYANQVLARAPQFPVPTSLESVGSEPTQVSNRQNPANPTGVLDVNVRQFAPDGSQVAPAVAERMKLSRNGTYGTVAVGDAFGN